MNTFAEKLEYESLKMETQNGAITLSSSTNSNLDFFSMSASMRGRWDDIVKLFKMAYKEDRAIAIKNMFYLRDVRGGQGEREAFRKCLKFLIDNESDEQIVRIVSIVPEYGRWDDVFYAVDVLRKTPGKSDALKLILKMIMERLRKDIDATNEALPNTEISLLAKWFPLDNCTRNEDKKILARFLARRIFKSISLCRKTISTLRKKLNVVEQKMCAKEWGGIAYPHIPSLAGMKYRKAFIRHDEERYCEFIKNVKNGKEKINAATIYPYEIVAKAKLEDDPTLDVMWKNLPDYTQGNSAICVVDVSGSMMCGQIAPIDVAISLGMYFSERNKGAFKDMFITFSGRPDVVKIIGETIHDRIQTVQNADWGMNTDIWKVIDLYLRLAKDCLVEDLPKSIIIISDMEFDAGVSTRGETYHDEIKAKFASSGIPMPSIVYWNVHAMGDRIPVKYNENGVVLVSGKSPVAFKFVMEGKTPLEFMMDILNSDRYKLVDEICK